MRYLILGLAVAGTAFLALALLGPFRGSDSAQDAPQVGSSRGNFCDRLLPTLGSEQITQEQFDAADAGLDEVISLAGQGDVDAAHLAFFSQVHGFTHFVDGPLRYSNDDLARRLCRAVVQIEAEFAFGREAATVAEEAAGIRDLLRQAAAELDFAPRRR